MDLEHIKKEVLNAIDRFTKFIQNPWYQIQHQKSISPEELTFYIVTLSVFPIIINLLTHFGIRGFVGIIIIPIRSVVTVSLWLIVGYIVHVIAFREKKEEEEPTPTESDPATPPNEPKKYDVLLVANLTTFASTFWILTQAIPYINGLAGLASFVLFCEAYSVRLKEPKSKVYIAYLLALVLILIPTLVAFRTY